MSDFTSTLQTRVSLFSMWQKFQRVIVIPRHNNYLRGPLEKNSNFFNQNFLTVPKKSPLSIIDSDQTRTILRTEIYPIFVHWAKLYPILKQWAELYPIWTHWAEPYHIWIHWAELYPILVQYTPQPIKFQYYVTHVVSQPESSFRSPEGSRLRWRSRCVNVSQLVFMRVGISMHRRVCSFSHKTRFVVLEEKLFLHYLRLSLEFGNFWDHPRCALSHTCLEIRLSIKHCQFW